MENASLIQNWIMDDLQCVGFWIDKQRKTLSPVKQKHGGHFQQTDGWVKI